MNTEQEMWKDIPEFEGRYAISNMGRAKSLERDVPYATIYLQHRSECILALSFTDDGYPRINLYQERSKHFVRKIHQLVLEAFVGPCPEGMEARHLNGNKLDNRLANLTWGTRLENMRDRKEQGGYDLRGEKHPSNKLTDKQVIEIRKMHASGKLTHRAIANKYNVCRSTITCILRGKTWSHIP